MRSRFRVTLAAVGVLVVAGTGVAVGAGTAQNASCTSSPVISTGATVASFDVHCSYPLPAAKTVTSTVTAPPVTSTTTATVTAPPQTVTQTVTAAPTSSTTTATVTPTVTPTTDAPARTMPNVPHMTAAQLLARFPGATFVQACRQLREYAIIDLPDGFNEQIVGFNDVNHMGLYCPYVLGFAGSNPAAARLSMAAGSATDPAVQYSMLLRQAQGIDDNQSTNRRPYPGVNVGWTLNGTAQGPTADQFGRTGPMQYNGIVNYIGRNTYWSDVKVTGIPGNGSYPPDETMAISEYKGDGNYYRNIEVDGRDATGARVGGSPFGSSGGKNVTIEDSYFHDSRASGLTFSYAGSEASGQNSETVTIRRTRVENNANHDSGQGHRFPGINFEGVRGNVLLDRVTIKLDTVLGAWDLSHISIASQMIDNPNFRIVEPTWNALASWTNGAFVVEEAAGYGTGNKQTTPPVVIKNGVQLTPFVYRGTPPQGYVAPIDPAKQFIVFTR